MGDTNNKAPGWSTLYLNLYDVLGYVAPGFILLAGLLLIGGRYGFCGWDLRLATLKHLVNSFALYVVAGGLVASYLAGHVLAAVSKVAERMNWFGLGRIPEYLFAGGTDTRLHYKRGVSPEILNRFTRAYYSIFLKETAPRAKAPYTDLIRGLVEKKELRYKDILWDCYDYIASHEPAQYYAVYSFLSLMGFFRAVTAAGVILSAFAFAAVDYGRFSGLDAVWLAVPVLLTLFSASRYVKFVREFYCQTLRSFATVVRD
jgi:hypothetical protein